jgi:uncharacterized cupin superfamily protein
MTPFARMTRLGSGGGARETAEVPYTVLCGTANPTGEASFKDASGMLQAGIAKYEPCKVRLTGYPYDEYCFLLEGRLIVTSEDGAVETYAVGDAFLLPRGFKGTWDMPNGIRKYYVVFDPEMKRGVPTSSQP